MQPAMLASSLKVVTMAEIAGRRERPADCAGTGGLGEVVASGISSDSQPITGARRGEFPI